MGNRRLGPADSVIRTARQIVAYRRVALFLARYNWSIQELKAKNAVEDMEIHYTSSLHDLLANGRTISPKYTDTIQLKSWEGRYLVGT